MSKSFNGKYVIAGTIAVVGIALAWRAIDRSQAGSRIMAPQSTPPIVQNALDGIRLDATADSPASAGFRSEVESRVRSVANQSEAFRALGMTPGQINDLGAAFADRVTAILNPDFDAVTAELARRGIALPTDEETRSNWEAGQEWLGDAPQIGVEQISVATVYDRGRLIEDHPVHDGWGVTTMQYDKSLMPIPMDPEQASLTIVEVRMPMEHKGIRSGKRRALPTGIQFAWDPKRSQWIPWSTRIFLDPADDQPYAALGFR